MTVFSDFTPTGPCSYEIPAGYRSDMRVPVRIYIDAAMLQSILGDRSVEQLINVATLPGVHGRALAMPDIHQGYGFPVGGVAAIRSEDGIISPGGIGYDINCGVRLLISGMNYDEVKERLKPLAVQMQRDVPSGVGRGGSLVLKERDLDGVLNQGCEWARRHGYAEESDLEATEEGGWFKQADAGSVSAEAKQRGSDQLGTIGAGNHFVEIQKVSAVEDRETAAAFGLEEGRICVMVHTGSRGLGHQVCTDYVRTMMRKQQEYGFLLPDRELACAPLSSPEGRQYLSAMAAAANFAWANRQLITYSLRESFKRILGPDKNLKLLYDVAHNIAKPEEYDGVKCIIHRKGATRAFGPGSEELPGIYRRTGQPVIIPGSMGTASYVLAGTEEAMRSSFGSCCHGAGRAMSRMSAKKRLDYQQLLERLKSKGIVVQAGSAKGLLEEAPEAYKDVDQVVTAVREAGLAKVVAKLIPCAVIKG